jgi:O-antigen ligase
MVAGTFAFLIGLVLCCTGGKRKLSNRICFAALIVIGASVIAWLIHKAGTLELAWSKFADIMRLDSAAGERSNMREVGYNDFLASPIFGAGFDKGYFVGEAKRPNFFSGMYHCIVAQIPASMGIVGCVAFVAHAFELLKLFFVKFSAPKFLLMMIPFMILVMSLVDNFFFYPNFQIFYGVFLALAERGQDQFIQHKKGASAPFCFFTRNVR